MNREPEMAAKRLLVADDEDDFRRILRDHFEDAGYAVEDAPDGLAALEIFDAKPLGFDLVITDIRMPRLDGGALIRELRQRRPYLPIIGITGQADLAGKLALLDQGAYYYLDKPLPHWPIVDRVVENAIRLHRYEEHVQRSRAKETEIARLVRSYLTRGPSTPTVSASEGPAARIALDFAVEHIETDRPGGDFAERFWCGPQEMGFYVADASGHDDLVSCFMACLASMVLHRCNGPGAPAPIDSMVVAVDEALHHLRVDGALGHERFLTLFLGTVDLVSGELAYVNAGHPEAFLLRGGAHGDAPRSIRLESNGRPAGFLFETAPQVDRVTLEPGDVLFVYTDGANEMLEDTASTRSGIERLASIVADAGSAPAAEIVARVAEALHGHAGQDGFADDTTLLALRVTAAR